MLVVRPRQRALFICLTVFVALGIYAFSLYRPDRLFIAPAEVETNPEPVHQTTPPPPSLPSTGLTVLLVTAFFPLKSKHPLSKYEEWMSKFLAQISTPVYMFTTEEMVPSIRALRGNLPITLNTTFASPFEIPPLRGLEGQYAEMSELDREKSVGHTPALYATWAAKPYFTREGLRNSETQYDYAFWSDAGSFRTNHVYDAWPDAQVVEEMFEVGALKTGTPKEDLIFFPTTEAPDISVKDWKEEQGPIDFDISEGSFFGGSPKAIDWWTNIYYAYHDAYLARGIFVGKDQTLINSIMFLNPRRIITVWATDPSAPIRGPIETNSTSAKIPQHLPAITHTQTLALGQCGSLIWYYYQWFLAAPASREEMTDTWYSRLDGLNYGAAIFNGDWWRGMVDRQRCRRTRLLSMEELLKNAFGNTWTIPSSIIEVPVLP